MKGKQKVSGAKKMPTRQPQRTVSMRGQELKKTGQAPFKAVRPYGGK